MRTVLCLSLLLFCACPDKKPPAETTKQAQQPVVSDGVADGVNTGNAAPAIDCKKACNRVHECEPSEPFDECVQACESIGAGLECAAAAKSCEEYKKCTP